MAVSTADQQTILIQDGADQTLIGDVANSSSNLTELIQQAKNFREWRGPCAEYDNLVALISAAGGTI